MSENKTKQSPSSASTEQKQVAGAEQLQSQYDEANARGYFGEVPDETPNEAYTVAGVTKNAKKA